MSEDPTPSAVKLFSLQDEKHDALRGEVAEIHLGMGEVQRRLDVAISEIKNLRERLEEGVSKTAFKAWEATQETRTTVADMKGQIRDGATLSAAQEKRLDRIDKFNDKVIYGMLVVVFLSIVSAVMTFLLNFKPHP